MQTVRTGFSTRGEHGRRGPEHGLQCSCPAVVSMPAHKARAPVPRAAAGSRRSLACVQTGAASRGVQLQLLPASFFPLPFSNFKKITLT